MRKFFFYTSMLSALSFMFTVFIFFFWAIFPYRVLEFGEGNGTVITTTVRAGDYVQMKQVSRKFMNLTSSIDRQFVDGIVYNVPTYYANRPVTDKMTTNLEYIYVPKALPPSTYRMVTVIKFHPNPIRTIEYTVVTNYFTVVK